MTRIFRSRPFRSASPLWQVGALERRVLLAADAAVMVAPAAEGTSAAVATETPVELARDASSAPVQLVIIDPSVDDVASLTAGIDGQYEMILLDANRPGMAQLHSIICARQNIQSVQVISHGRAGQIRLGNQSIDAQVLQDMQQSIRDWSAHLTPSADILLFGCRVGAGTDGRQLVHRLAQLSGADVAASTDDTGRSADGRSDWNLELQVGPIEAALAVDERSRAAYESRLALSDPTTNSLATTQIVIRAAGETGDERMQLLVDGQVVRTWSSVSKQLRDYTFNTSAAVTADDIQVAFVNDRYIPGRYDRNLRVDSIKVNGQIYETEAPTVYSTGTWLPADGVVPGYRQSEMLHTNGYFQYSSQTGPLASLTLEQSGNLIYGVTVAESNNALIKVLRGGQLDTTVRVDYQTVVSGVGPTEGVDYLPTSGTLTFAPGVTEQTISVVTLDDNVGEPLETLNVVLSNPQNATLDAPLLPNVTSLQQSVNIMDNDAIIYSIFDGRTPASMAFNNDASQAPPVPRGGPTAIRLARQVAGSYGTAYHLVPFDVADRSFETNFEMMLTSIDVATGGDGLTFILQSAAAGTNAAGTLLGYEGIPNSVAIEFGITPNASDPSGNHVSLLVNGNVTTPLATAPLSFSLNANTATSVYAWVTYDASSNILNVYASNANVRPSTPVLSVPIDLTQYLTQSAYLGFGGSSNDGSTDVTVRSWQFGLV